MKIVRFEVEIRINSAEEENRALLSARYHLMDVPGVLSVAQIGGVLAYGNEEKNEEKEESVTL